MSKYDQSNALEIYTRLHNLLKQPVYSTMDDDGNVEPKNKAAYSRIDVVIGMCDAFRTGNIRVIAYGEHPYIVACLPQGALHFTFDNGKITQRGVKLDLEHGKQSSIHWADFSDHNSSYHTETEDEILSNIYSIEQAISDIHKILFDALEGLNPILAKLLWIDEDDGRMNRDMAEHFRRWDRIAHPGQKCGNSQNQLLLGGIGSGKTRATLEDVLAFAWNIPGINAAIVDHDLSTSRGISLLGLEAILPESVKSHRDYRKDVHNMSIKLPNGSYIRFFNDEHYEALRGHIFNYVGMSDIHLWKNFDDTSRNLEICHRADGPKRTMIACTHKPMAIIKAICTGKVPDWDVSYVNTAENIHNLGKAAQEYMNRTNVADTAVYDGPDKSYDDKSSDGTE